MQNKIQNLLNFLKKEKHLRELFRLQHQGKFITKDYQKLLNLASNDYLGIAQNLKFQNDFLSQLKLDSTLFSSSSSRSLSGNFEIFEEFEELLCTLYAPKKALLFNSGYHANIGVIDSLYQLEGTIFLVDSFVHASIFDGLKISRAKFMRFKHNDLFELEEMIQKYTHQYEHIIIVSEGIFSMDGDFCPILELVEFKKKYKNILLYIDESHSIGVYGESMLGIAKELNILQSVDFLILAFGKAIGSIGGCVLCSEVFRQYFINKARSFIFSTALPPINIAFSLYVFKNLLSFKQNQKKLYHLSTYLKQQLQDNVKNFIGQYQIISLITYNNKTTLELMQKFQKYGFFAPAIRPPSVPKNQSRIRLSLHANLDLKDLQYLMDVLCK